MVPQSWIEVEVARKSLITPEVAFLELRNTCEGALPLFTAGSHVDVEIAPGLVRQYSLIEGPGDPAHYRIAVLREKVSRGGSAAIHDLVRPGDRLRIGVPRNNFALVDTARRSVLYAGGIGITPILCMAERLSQMNARFELFYYARTRMHAAFLSYVESGRIAERTHLHFTRDQRGRRFDPTRDVPTFEPGSHLYVCGPVTFTQAVLDGARLSGWPEECLHRELFTAQNPSQSAKSESFRVKIASTGLTLEVPPDRTVAQVLTEAGIDLPMSCEQGVCGTCLTRIIDGIPDHRDVFLTDEEHTRNDQFTPCCSRAHSPLLVLDL